MWCGKAGDKYGKTTAERANEHENGKNNISACEQLLLPKRE